MTKWQYKIVQFSERSFFSGQLKADKVEEELNKLGNQGWELVSLSSQGSMGASTVAILKKPH